MILQLPLGNSSCVRMYKCVWVGVVVILACLTTLSTYSTCYYDLRTGDIALECDVPDEDDALTLKDMMELLVLNDLPPANKWTHHNFDALCLFVMNYVVKIYGIAKVAETMKKNPGLIVVEWLHPSDYGWAVFVIQNASDRWNQEAAIARKFHSEKDAEPKEKKAPNRFMGHGSKLHSHAVNNEGQAYLAEKTEQFRELLRNNNWRDIFNKHWVKFGSKGKPFKESYQVDNDSNGNSMSSVADLEDTEVCLEFDISDDDDDDEFGAQQDSDDDADKDYTINEVNLLSSAGRSTKSSSKKKKKPARVSMSASKPVRNGDSSELDDESEDISSHRVRKKPRRKKLEPLLDSSESESESDIEDEYAKSKHRYPRFKH